jgi:hypothetical protein
LHANQSASVHASAKTFLPHRRSVNPRDARLTKASLFDIVNVQNRPAARALFMREPLLRLALNCESGAAGHCFFSTHALAPA